MNQSKQKILFYITCVILVILTRIIPHSPNFTPVLAFALFSGATINNFKIGITLPLITMFISDLFLQAFYGYGIHSTIPFVYSSLVLIALIGKVLLDNINGKNVLKFSIISSCLFFIVSNLGVFITSNFYPNSPDGLITCYVAAVPFFINTFISTIFYSFILFKIYEVLFFQKHKSKNFNLKKLWN